MSQPREEMLGTCAASIGGSYPHKRHHTCPNWQPLAAPVTGAPETPAQNEATIWCVSCNEYVEAHTNGDMKFCKNCDSFLTRIAKPNAPDVESGRPMSAEPDDPLPPPAALQDYWRCFHCDFATKDRAEAEAHFGERDDAEEFKPICKWWASMEAGEKLSVLQDTIKDLNYERGEGYDIEAGRWQSAIYKLLISQAGESIDGGGCDSGDPLDFTLAEVSQALAILKDKADASLAENTRLRAHVVELREALEKANGIIEQYPVMVRNLISRKPVTNVPHLTCAAEKWLKEYAALAKQEVSRSSHPRRP
jgi:hypothetical protein